MFLVASLGIAVKFPEVQIVFGFLGGICCGGFMILIPALLRVHLYPRWRVPVTIAFTLLMMTGVLGAFFNIFGVTS